MDTNQNLAALSNQIADAVEIAGRAVVTVNGRERQSATGIVVGEDRVLTADHVLERDDNLTITTADGVAHDAQLLGRDPSTDLALLKVPGLKLPVAAQAAMARVGQLALAVGRPSEEGVMASIGVVSAVGGPVRRGRGVQLERYIRTDATPYPGFSGGPLIDASGAVLGVLTTGLMRGTPIVIPIEIALAVADTLARQGSIKRGYLGVVSQQVTLPVPLRSETQDHGLLVIKVEEGSPAEQGGVLMGDILLGVDGNAVQDADDLLALLTGQRVGRPVALRVSRGGASRDLSVVVGSRL